jgi:hypothetical protein
VVVVWRSVVPVSSALGASASCAEKQVVVVWRSVVPVSSALDAAAVAEKQVVVVWRSVVPVSSALDAAASAEKQVVVVWRSVVLVSSALKYGSFVGGAALASLNHGGVYWLPPPSTCCVRADGFTSEY